MVYNGLRSNNYYLQISEGISHIFLTFHIYLPMLWVLVSSGFGTQNSFINKNQGIIYVLYHISYFSQWVANDKEDKNKQDKVYYNRNSNKNMNPILCSVFSWLIPNSRLKADMFLPVYDFINYPGYLYTMPMNTVVGEKLHKYNQTQWCFMYLYQSYFLCQN